ncbi:Fur-regulated basic protein FbpA [Priestia filamentosa]|uniref:Fur-regulated basic protein FbpA n=1 Tax=Priestia filamentosa TaxID=1402861 RepID=UPI000A083209|nr:Fur-regulated basic protein FbpA [Priestia filamentosa]SMF37282.1 Fur-regulated basic protein A [Priestia filamentosa]
MQLKGAVEQRKEQLIQQLIFDKGYIKEEYNEQLYELTLSELEALYVKYAREKFSISYEVKK